MRFLNSSLEWKGEKVERAEAMNGRVEGSEAEGQALAGLTRG